MYDVVVWAAVSTAEQAEKASIEHQLALADAWIERNGARKVAELVVPGHTREYTFLYDAMKDIPAYAGLVQMVSGTQGRPGKRFNLLLAYDHTRLARSEALLAQIREFLGENGIQIAYTQQFIPLVPPDEFDYKQAFSVKALSALQGIATSQEISQLRARAKFGKEAKAMKGFYVASYPPYGFRKVPKGRLEPVEEEVLQLRKMFQLYLEEGMGLARTARALNRLGYRNRRGNPWIASTVREAMLNPAVIGKVAWGRTRTIRVPSGDNLKMRKKLIPGTPILCDAHEPVISPEDYQRMLDELERRKVMRRGADNQSPRVYLLTGILWCGHCGGRMIGRIKVPRGITYLYYICYTHVRHLTCPSGHVLCAAVEEQVDEIVRDLCRQKDLSAVVEGYLAEHEPRAAREDVEAELKRLADRKRRLEEAYLDGAMDLLVYKTHGREIDDTIQSLLDTQTALKRMERTKARATKLLDDLSALLTDDAPLSSVIPRPQLKLIYRDIFEKIVVRDGKVVDFTLQL